MGLRFDRRVTDDLMNALGAGGPFAGLAGLLYELGPGLDLQLRSQQGPRCHASLYYGLTSVLDVVEQGGKLALRAHPTHRRAGGFDEAWQAFASVEVWTVRWPAVEEYLHRLVPGGVYPRWVRAEGIVQATVSAGPHDLYGAVQREAVLWSNGGEPVAAAVAGLAEQCWQRVVASGRQENWWPGVRDGGTRPAVGDELDVLAVDGERLLCVEVKPAGAVKGVAWSPVQAWVYAELFGRWYDEDPLAAEVLAGMAAQRSRLGLLDCRWETGVGTHPRVVPVVAIGAGKISPHALDRLYALWEVTVAPAENHGSVDPLEVWLLDGHGDPVERWVPESGERPPSRPNGRSGVTAGAEPYEKRPDQGWFQRHARAAQAEWMRTSPLLPDGARVPGRYGGRGRPLPYVLAEGFAEHNLLGPARGIALERFAAAGIRWHGDDHGSVPSNHLLSSQVQCLNALAPLVRNPGGLASWLGQYLPVEQVVKFGSGHWNLEEEADAVVFEWPGLLDHLGEWRGVEPARGAYVTSVDAAVRYRTRAGSTELALIEWKYTESYPDGGRLDGTAHSHAVRLGRYRSLVEDPEGPIALPAGVDYEDLFAEPVYQLMRLQLLAWQMEQAGELDAERVVVVYAAPAHNEALLNRSVGSPRFARYAARSGGLIAAWKALLRRPDRFMHVDTADLVALPAVVGDDFVGRYRHLADRPLAGAGPGGAEKAQPRPNTLSGEQLGELAFDGDISDVWVGRQGGLDGTALAEDVATGRWKCHRYPVARGAAAPNRQWFSLGHFLARVAETRRQQRAAVGWEVCGVVPVDTSTVAIAAAGSARRLDPRAEPPEEPPEGIAVLFTGADADLPVEAKRVDGKVMEVRLDAVDDVDETPGSWKRVTDLVVGADGVIAYDPYRDVASRAVPVAVDAGTWAADQFEAGDGNPIALRIRRQPS